MKTNSSLNMLIFKLILFVLLITCFFILKINIVSSININEVMYAPSNELGGTYNEWLEIYCDKDFKNLKLVDEYGKSTKTSYFNCSDSKYLIIVRKKQSFCEIWDCENLNLVEGKISLKNDKDNLRIYDQENEIDFLNYEISKPISGNSLQLFENTWKECIPTPGYENYCEEKNEGENNGKENNKNKEEVQATQTPIKQEQQVEDETKQEETDNTKTQKQNTSIKDKTNPVTSNMIYLNTKTEENQETIYSSPGEKIKKYFLPVFTSFCLLVILILLLKKEV